MTARLPKATIRTQGEREGHARHPALGPFAAFLFAFAAVSLQAVSPDASPGMPSATSGLSDARAILETARELGVGNPLAAIELLEKGLADSGSLAPWYLAELTRESALARSWTAARNWGARLAALSVPADLADTAAWWYGLALEKTGDAPAAARVYRARIDGGACGEPLIWLAYLRTADSGAEKVSASLDAAFPLLKLTAPDTYALSRYLAGLCAVRSGEWNFAAVSLARFESIRGTRFPEYAPWSAFYLAWSHNRSGRTREALAAFTSYLDRWPTHERAWQAATAAALAASQDPGAGVDAAVMAERAIAKAPTRADRADSMILRSTILLDRGDRAGAERDLPGIVDGSLTGGATPSASRAQFLYAEIAFRSNDFEAAVSRWNRLISAFPSEALAEEALYRIGDAYYIAGDWKSAGTAFTRYRSAWPSGRFLAAVLRSGGESWYRSGSNDLAVLWWEDLLAKFPDSSAVPGAMRDLASAYRARKDYQAALRVSRRYLERFPKEAVLDGIEAQIGELTGLAGGTAGSASAMASAYSREGGSSTASGRMLGLSLAKEYLGDWNRRNEARKILEELTTSAPKTPDGQGSADRRARAEAMSLLANVYREDARYRDASALFLSSGTWFAAVDPERAAEALFGAVDTFLLAGSPPDAQKTLETMRKTWPDSVWTRRALVAASR